MRRALPHVDLRVEALIQLGQRFREGQAIAVKQILMLLMLFRQDIQQRRVGLAHVDVQTHAVDLAEGDALQSLVEHSDTVLLALNGFANNVGHAAGADGQLLFAVCQLFGQAAELNLHLLDRFHRVIGADNILADTLAQMLVDGNEELNFALRALRIFRDTQHVTQMFVIGDRQTQRTERLIRHRTQFVGREIGQLAAMQTTFDAVVFHQTHHRAPARLGADNLLTHFAVIAFQLAQFTGQVVHFRFAEGQRFFQLIATGAVVAQLRVQLVTTLTRALFRPGIGTHADILQLFIQIVEQLFFGVIRALQRRQHLVVLVQLRNVATHRFARAATLRFRLLQTLAQLLVEIAVATEHLRRIGVAEVGPALHDFRQRESLLTRIALGLLRIGVIFFQLLKLLRIALQYRDDRLQLRQLIAMLLNKAHCLLRFVQTFLDLVHAVSQRIIRQQVQARQQAVERRHALFRLLILHAVLLVIALMGVQRTLQLAAAAVKLADLFFRIVLESHRQMAANEAAESLVKTLGFLHVERQGRETLGETLTLSMQCFDAIFARRATKQRQRWET